MSFKVTPSIAEFSMFMLLQGIAPGISWLGGGGGGGGVAGELFL